MTVARGNPASYEVLVDTWPHFGIVLTRLRPEVLLGVPLTLATPHTPWGQGVGQLHLALCVPQDNKDPRDFYANQLTVFYRDEGAWRALLRGTEVVDWTRAFQIHGEPGTEWGEGLGPLPCPLCLCSC